MVMSDAPRKISGNSDFAKEWNKLVEAVTASVMGNISSDGSIEVSQVNGKITLRVANSYTYEVKMNEAINSGQINKDATIMVLTTDGAWVETDSKIKVSDVAGSPRIPGGKTLGVNKRAAVTLRSGAWILSDFACADLT